MNKNYDIQTAENGVVVKVWVAIGLLVGFESNNATYVFKDLKEALEFIKDQS